MDSGSSTDLSNTSGTNDIPEYDLNSIIYEHNPDGKIIPAEDLGSVTYGNTAVNEGGYGDTRNSISLYSDAYAKNAPVWNNTETDNPGNYTGSSFFMNGYQGPLNYSSFEQFSSPSGFLPLASTSMTRDIELSRIAQQNAQSPEVKAFADLVVQDQSGSSQELGSIALSQGIILQNSGYAAVITSDPSRGLEDYDRYYSSDNYSSYAGAGNTSAWSDTGTSNTDMNSTTAVSSYDASMLRNLDGRYFDRQYMRIMLQDQYKTLELFNSAAQSDDPQVRDFARRSLPVINDRISRATDIYNSLL